MRLSFVETVVFTQRVRQLGLEDSVRALQAHLLADPEAGDIDPGTGGLRKVRMGDARRGTGKRGGARVHYLWLPHVRRVYLIYVYGKQEMTRLSAPQKRALSQVVQAIKSATTEARP